MKRNLFLSVLFVLMFAPAHAQQVNILSYNVHNCIGMDKEYNYRRIANVISQTSPDIVALQELDSVTVRNKGIHALGELEKLTGMHGTYAAAIPFQGGSYGIGILSREIPIKQAFPSWNWQNILPPSMTQPLILSRQTVPTDV